MPSKISLLLIICVTVVLCGSTFVRADEAVLQDGRQLQGKLTLLRAGSLRFVGRENDYPLSEIQSVRFAGRVAPFLAGTVHQVQIKRRQRLTGEILALDAESLQLRTAGSERLTVPRGAIISLTHLADLITCHDEDFEADLKSWKLTAAPALSELQRTSGRRSLRFDQPGQSAEFALPSPLQSGRAGINFHDPGSGSGVRCFLEAEFAAEKKTTLVKIMLSGKIKDYAVETPLAAEETVQVHRTAGWHRLSLRFAPAYLMIGVDDALLWSSAKEGPGGALRKLRLICAEKPDAGRGAVFFDDLSLARFAEQRVSRLEDKKQDELWLLSGDQLFGTVVRADRRSIELDARFGRRTFPWGDVRGIFFKQTDVPKDELPRAAEGERIRLGFHIGCGTQTDELEGKVLTLDDEHLTLRHAELGELKIDRARLKYLRLAEKLGNRE